LVRSCVSPLWHTGVSAHSARGTFGRGVSVVLSMKVFAEISLSLHSAAVTGNEDDTLFTVESVPRSNMGAIPTGATVPLSELQFVLDNALDGSQETLFACASSSVTRTKCAFAPTSPTQSVC
jgi:hypothetical protein